MGNDLAMLHEEKMWVMTWQMGDSSVESMKNGMFRERFLAIFSQHKTAIRHTSRLTWFT